MRYGTKELVDSIIAKKMNEEEGGSLVCVDRSSESDLDSFPYSTKGKVKRKKEMLCLVRWCLFSAARVAPCVYTAHW